MPAPILAIICLTSWCWPISSPNVLRSWAYLTRRIEARLGQPDRADCHRVAALVDGAHGDREALALLADAVLDRDAHVVEVDLAGVAGPDAELALDRPR